MKGNIARVCRSRNKSLVKSRQTEQPGRSTKAKGLHTMHEECLGDVGDANTVYAVKAVKPGAPFKPSPITCERTAPTLYGEASQANTKGFCVS